MKANYYRIILYTNSHKVAVGHRTRTQIAFKFERSFSFWLARGKPKGALHLFLRPNKIR